MVLASADAASACVRASYLLHPSLRLTMNRSSGVNVFGPFKRRCDVHNRSLQVLACRGDSALLEAQRAWLHQVHARSPSAGDGSASHDDWLSHYLVCECVR